MKIIRIFKIRVFVMAAALSIGLGLVSPAFAFIPFTPVIVNPEGKLTYLGTLGGTYSWATGINAAGQVAGYSDTAGNGSHHAFITGPNGVGMTDLNSFVELPGSDFYIMLTESIIRGK